MGYWTARRWLFRNGDSTQINYWAPLQKLWRKQGISTLPPTPLSVLSFGHILEHHKRYPPCRYAGAERRKSPNQASSHLCGSQDFRCSRLVCTGTVNLKILLQKVWERKLSWDEIIPTELEGIWSAWKEELPLLTQQAIPRRLFQSEQEVIDRQLHGFCDASTAAYGGVVYIHTLHTDTSLSIAVITAETRVALLLGLAVPKLELCGALLLSKLLTVTATDLNVPINHIYAWSNLSVVLGWLNKTPTKSLLFIASRVRDILSQVSAERWRYVATDANPADCASRVLLPQKLLKNELWWQGPPCLKSPLSSHLWFWCSRWQWIHGGEVTPHSTVCWGQWPGAGDSPTRPCREIKRCHPDWPQKSWRHPGLPYCKSASIKCFARYWRLW